MASISGEGIALIKRWEGLRLEAYQDVAGIWTIGYGHTGSDVHEGQVITEGEAEELLRRDLQRFERGVNDATRVEITQSMFDALTSFAYNVGVSAMRGSTAIKRLNKGDFEGAAEALTWWNKATIDGIRQVVLGLARRRAAEAALFLRDVDQLRGRDQEPDLAGVEVEENPPRRNNPITSRTTGGAVTAGGAGAAGAGAVLLDKDDDDAPDAGDPPPGDDTGEDTNGDDPADDVTEDTPTVTEGETAEGEDTPATGEDDTDTQTGTEVPADDAGGRLSESDTNEAFIVACGVLAVLAAIYVIGARIDDWRKYRR